MSKSQSRSWKFQKYSSILLIPIVSYFLFKILLMSSMTYKSIINEANSMIFLLLVLIFTIIGLLHMRLGLHEIVEDYVHIDNMKKASFIGINLFVIGIMSIVLVSVLLILFK